MLIKANVIKKILNEEKKHYFELEFGGYITIENDTVTDIIFDVEKQSHGYVKLGIKELLKVPKDKQKLVRGWFHKHPIEGLSQLDMMTTMKLTNFWKECYTVVLQSNRKLLLVKTIQAMDFVLRTNFVVEVFREEMDIQKHETNIFTMPKITESSPTKKEDIIE